MMAITLDQFTLLPEGYDKKDPRNLLYWYPTTINVVLFAKQMQTFYFYKQLEVAEDMAKRMGCLLLPYSCIHWKRAKDYGSDRKLKIGRNSYFLMKPDELTKGEIRKLQMCLEEIHKTPMKVVDL